MYVHSAYPNHVYAIDMTKEGWPIKWKYTPVQDDRAVAVACCDLVHQGVQLRAGQDLHDHARRSGDRARRRHRQGSLEGPNADPTRGETQTMAGLVIKDKYIVGVSGGEFGIRGWVAAYDLADGKQVWKAYSMGPDADVKLAPDFKQAVILGTTWMSTRLKMARTEVTLTIAIRSTLISAMIRSKTNC